jgi:hypothetical protein
MVCGVCFEWDSIIGLFEFDEEMTLPTVGTPKVFDELSPVETVSVKRISGENIFSNLYGFSV